MELNLQIANSADQSGRDEMIKKIVFATFNVDFHKGNILDALARDNLL